MEDIEAQKQYLYDLIMKAMTIQSDEKEGTQVIDLVNDVNLCGSDYIDTEEPDMTPEEINTLFHFNDPNVNPNAGTQTDDINKNDDSSDGDSINKPQSSLIDDGSKMPADANNIPGTDKGGLVGNRTGNKPDPNKPHIERNFHDYNNIKIPKDTDIDDIVRAIIEDKNPDGLNHAIIEFAQPCIRDEKGVDFQFYVKPGQKLTPDTIIGKATINGKTKEIRSIFESGTVLANEDGTDFKHLYNGYGANRHIIIEDFDYCGEAPDINTDVIDEVTDMFKDRAYIYQLICDNIAESVLPFILQKRYTEYKYKYIGPLKVRDERPNGRELFGRYLKHVVEPLRKNYQDAMQALADEKNVKACNGNTRKLKALGDQIIACRDSYAEQMIWCFQTASRTLDNCEYDPDYSDCSYLGAEYDIKEGEKDTYIQIGEEDYNNYYMSLLSKVFIATENKWSLRYHNLLKKIVENRIALEVYPVGQIISEFNNQFKRQLNKSYSDAWSQIDAMMKTKADGNISDVISWMTEHTRQKQADEWAPLVYQQLANIYMFVKNYNPKQASVSELAGMQPIPGQKHPLLKLVEDEWRQISEFWSEAIAEYHRFGIQECIQAITEIPAKIEKYHSWPSASPFSVGYNEYEHYLFENFVEVSQDIEDEDYGGDYDTTVPDIPDDFPVPPDQPLNTLLDNPIEPDEPTPKDFKYWVKYFSLATVISLPYFNCGLDIPPFVMMIPLPCIFICVGCVYIKLFDITIVFGIAIRGMWIWPIVLFVNLSNSTASILTPLIGIVKSLISKLSAKINSLAEKPITAMANGFINMIEADSKQLRNQNKQLDVCITQLKTKKTKNAEKIKKKGLRALDPTANLKQQIVDPLSAQINR